MAIVVSKSVTMDTVQPNDSTHDELRRINNAVKRSPRDPIFVSMAETKLDAGLSKVEKPKGAVFKQLMKEFEKDKIIKLVKNRKAFVSELSAFLKKPLSPESVNADVSVVSKAYLKEKVGISKKTGKPGKMVAVVFEADITSHFLPQTFRVKESGHILRNTEVTKRFAAKVQKIILKEIGPNIPQDRSI